MDFAKKILGKYGWKEGDGLGRNNDGITVPLKANLKFDNAGLGVDHSKEFNDHWWVRCFKEAAENVDVRVQKDGQVSTARKQGEEAVEISTQSYSIKKMKKATEQRARAGEGGTYYQNFLQSATLTKSNCEVKSKDYVKMEDIAVASVNVLSDEELFRACGGRTAHKGARHGIKQRGKLARLEQQEQEMLEKLQKSKGMVESVDINKTKKKTRQLDESKETVAMKQQEREKLEELQKSEDIVESVVVYKTKKNRNKSRRLGENEAEEVDSAVRSTKKKKKKV
ncbi:G patch domain-containing protein 4 [Scaptodrosophila lebanonensis]|uniref:G patch domain-containing protein 4 n=1 Tax=Drosophila lebanonensis TaxID=7225 RepID=A0A6J2SZI8_DROLE|nr:G patch domain-containing protein 4 [Scaptodrosophila lebanonensis]